MAKLNKKGNLKGKIGNLVYRELGTQNIVQIKPGKVRQTLNTKIAAQEFGMASNAAWIIRRIGSLLYEHSDPQMNGRLNSELLKCLQCVPKAPGERHIGDIDPAPLTGFQFNLEGPFEQALKVPLSSSVEADGTIVIRQQGLDLSTIPYLETEKGYQAAAFLRIALAGIDYVKEEVQLLHQEDRLLADALTSRNRFFPPLGEEWRCLKKLRENLIVLVYGSLHYCRWDWLGQIKMLFDKRFNAAGILLAFKVDEQMFQLNRAHAIDAAHEPMQKADSITFIQNEKIAAIAHVKGKEKKRKK